MSWFMLTQASAASLTAECIADCTTLYLQGHGSHHAYDVQSEAQAHFISIECLVRPCLDENVGQLKRLLPHQVKTFPAT